jgi:hypothetical protein
VLEFLPRHGMTGETHSAQESAGQVYLPVAIGAQRALQREQSGGRGGETRQHGRETIERLSHMPAFVVPLRPASSTSYARRTRWAGRQGIRNRCCVRNCSCAGGAHVRQAPDSAALLAHEHQEQGAGARLLTRVPTATAFPALARAEMRRKYVTAGMLGQVSNGG